MSPQSHIALKRITTGILTLLGVLTASDVLMADEPASQAPARPAGTSVEEERHDRSDARKRHSNSLDQSGWVSYDKNPGYQVDTNACSSGRCARGGLRLLQYAPVLVNPPPPMLEPSSAFQNCWRPFPRLPAPPSPTPGN